MQVPMGVLIGATLSSLAAVSAAQQPIAYPAKGQSAQQQKDIAECQAWAQQSTGISPATVD